MQPIWYILLHSKTISTWIFCHIFLNLTLRAIFGNEREQTSTDVYCLCEHVKNCIFIFRDTYSAEKMGDSTESLSKSEAEALKELEAEFQRELERNAMAVRLLQQKAEEAKQAKLR